LGLVPASAPVRSAAPTTRSARKGPVTGRDDLPRVVDPKGASAPAPQTLVEALPTDADPADPFCRGSDHDRVVGDVAGDDRTGPDQRVTADGHPAHDGGVRAQDRAALHQGAEVPVGIGPKRTGP